MNTSAIPATKDRAIPDDETDLIIVRQRCPFWLWAIRKRIKPMIRAIIDRAHERGKINSYASHELHALVHRAILLLACLCCIGCSTPIPDAGAAVTAHAQSQSSPLGMASAVQQRSNFYGGAR